jgi:hypothetical protein
MTNSTLTHIWATISASIHAMGVTTFAIAVVITVVLYRLHPVLGILGALVLFGFLTGMIH